MGMVEEEIEMNGSAYKKIKAYATQHWNDFGIQNQYRTFDAYFRECLKEWKRANKNERKVLCPK